MNHKSRFSLYKRSLCFLQLEFISFLCHDIISNERIFSFWNLPRSNK